MAASNLPVRTDKMACSYSWGDDEARREFITLVGGVTAWPFATHAQPAKLPTIGFLGTATPSTWGQFVTAFVQRLRDLGWVEGRMHKADMGLCAATGAKRT